ncbi:Phospholipase/carboxylesterase [Macrophomina phaseolina MS6]|uniref:Phospholipase/carboxylesterase n=2 Tax=Macrophomina phaseolina TaxID=35725 RepID=K2SPY6_MACPH|nr:Phospholipase/carboxylesterase [Macrophomina phaseolina MS6]KAH7042698.1 Alpha/Beta hydrolase protein [Macrophomina phaseolina]
MPKRQPTQQDFPSAVTLSIISPPPSSSSSSSSHPPPNVLILLHGLGDTHASFATLGRQLNLPETLCLAVRAPAPLPFDLGGHHWGDDIQFDQATGSMSFDTGFRAATRLLLDNVIRETLLDACGYTPREILLFGYGQGGMAALRVAAEMGADEELGGVVSIGGWLPSDAPLQPVNRKCRTPVLLCKAARLSNVSDGEVKRLKDNFDFVEVREWARAGDGMPRNREEMLPIMQFFARRLRSMKGVPDGAVELS